MSALRALLAAFSYFSILPVRSFREAPAGAVIAWLPLVGACVGALAGFAAWGIAHVAGAPDLAPAVALAASVVFTGAIHLDGFLDSCDALFMSAPATRRLAVMKDPHHGSYAIAGMALLTVLWLAALAQIAPAHMPLALALAGLFGRACVVPLVAQYPHARTRNHDPQLRWPAFAWMIVAAMIAAVFASTGRYDVAAAAVVAYGVGQALAWWAASRLGGLTGDVYGAIVVVAEVGVLFALR